MNFINVLHYNGFYASRHNIFILEISRLVHGLCMGFGKIIYFTIYLLYILRCTNLDLVQVHEDSFGKAEHKEISSSGKGPYSQAAVNISLLPIPFITPHYKEHHPGA